jgi:hypothetical protein
MRLPFLFFRVLPRRARRRAVRSVGSCRTCGVVFAASEDERRKVEQVLRAHERICPGGRRRHEVVTPYD